MADAPPVRVLRDVEYAAVPGYRPLPMDLYLPAAGPAPLVLYAHGGGWRAGSRASFGPAYDDWTVSPFAELAAAGLAVASVDYRLSGEARYPAQLTDVAAALDRLRTDGGRYGIDAGRVAVWGESAGGHLAALLALTVDGVSAAVAWYAPVDFARPIHRQPPVHQRHGPVGHAHQRVPAGDRVAGRRHPGGGSPWTARRPGSPRSTRPRRTPARRC